MRRTQASQGLIIASAIAAGALAFAQPETAPAAPQPASEIPGLPEDKAFVLWPTMNLIDGTPQRLDAYRGKVVLMVNTASKCGLTPQYEALEKLYREHKDRGLVILAFPANNFAGQEPGTNKEIAEFCTQNYGVTFPVFEKISVKGDDCHLLYRQLAGQPEPIGGEPKWNFTKFLIDRSGRVVARFEPRITPDDPRVIEKIKELLEAGGSVQEAGAE